MSKLTLNVKCHFVIIFGSVRIRSEHFGHYVVELRVLIVNYVFCSTSPLDGNQVDGLPPTWNSEDLRTRINVNQF